MYIDTSQTTVRGKTYTRYLLRDSYREKGKVKHHTLANLSKLPPHVIMIIKAALKGEMIPKDQAPDIDQVCVHEGPAFGAVYVLAALAKRLNITAALKQSPYLRQILWLLIARIIDQGSRPSAARLAEDHAAKEVLGLESTSPSAFYRALDWVAVHQEDIEKQLFKKKYLTDVPQLFLYDVTSSYLEGRQKQAGKLGLQPRQETR